MNKKLLSISQKLLKIELDEYGIPPIENHKICLAYGDDLAKKYGVDPDFIAASLNFMDLKIGEAFKQGQIQNHVQMSLDATMDAIGNLYLDKETLEKLEGCIISHHGRKNYPSIEAEICANADCFKFLHPRGVFAFLTALGKRGMSFEEVLKYAKSKLDEKIAIISLPEVKEEAQRYYDQFEILFNVAKSRK